jgi:RNA polymerase sigma-70 factor (ECF subfamily)
VSRGILRAMRDPGPRRESHEAGEDDLVERARAGDRRAFDRIVEIHLPRVWRVVYRVLRHREDTEDVVQEVFVTAHRSLREFRGDSQLSTWLHRIAVTRALNHAERASERMRRSSDPIESAPEPASPAPTPLHALEAKELRRRLADCLGRVPEAWRAVLALRDAEGMAYEEIASVLGVALGTVRSRLSRARTLLQECVEGAA